MRISVVIPAYNEEKFIGNCLESLMKQTVAPDEIIVVDNLSEDRTAAIAKAYNARVVVAKTRGMAHARNFGFNAARYEIIARCDADTVVPANWIERIKTDFQKPVDGLTGPIIYPDAIFKWAFFSKLYIHILKLVTGYYPLTGINMIVTKKIWLKVRNQVCSDDKKVHEDIDLTMHIKKKGGVIGYDPLLVVKSSGRRMNNNFRSFFIEYPVRMFRTLYHRVN